MDLIEVTQQDIDDLAKKLDEFSAVLTDRERGVLYGVLGMAGKSIEELIRAGEPTTPTTAPTAVPPLSAQFKDAFENGVGTRFRIRTPTEAEATNVRVKGGVDGDWAKAVTT